MNVLDHGSVSLVNFTPDPALAVVNAARCSYSSTSTTMTDGDRKLVRYLSDNAHTSPFRHTYLTFKVKAPLFVFRQWWKYQVGSTWREYELPDGAPIAFDIYCDEDKGCSWNEVSGRYKELSPEFYLPKKMRTNAGHANKQGSGDLSEDFDHETCISMIESSYKSAVVCYNLLLSSGVAKELARLVLPPAIYSECYWTVSLQSALHFLKERLDSHAQWEIQQYAQAVRSEMSEILKDLGITI